MAEWNYSKLPESEYDNVQRLLEERNGKELMKIHNKYKMSANDYCCSEETIISHFNYLIKNYSNATP